MENNKAAAKTLAEKQAEIYASLEKIKAATAQLGENWPAAGTAGHVASELADLVAFLNA